MKNNKTTIGLQMAECFRVFGKCITYVMLESEIRIPVEQFILLNLIHMYEQVNQQELAMIWMKDKSSVLRLTYELEKKRLVVRVVDSLDRRRKTLILTPQGKQMLDQLLEIEAQVVEKLLSGINEVEIKVLVKVLARIEQNGKDKK